ncbi:lectin-like protein [Ruminococcus difficilis]|uniref:RICIN domain-containing protein n=1 Tax=Ruminococcus difficilis TaxID=2763069 RepID=A0A934WU81_9FIRM|nr:lectin-like protein [Ruminococcus difficilis]MBK6089965.1 RICIN domain-containing protein [Ruminococcus difficilis]
MLKKVLSVLLTAALLLSAVAVTFHAAEIDTSDESAQIDVADDGAEIRAADVAAQVDVADTGVTLYWPVYGHTSLSRGYGGGHNGIDICDGSINGATVRAAIGGTVTSIWLCSNNHYGTSDPMPSCCSGNGHGLVIHGDDGRYYNYAHMQAGSIPTDKIYYGARVEAGQTIGRVGSTGNSSGPHLHFQISTSSSWWLYGIVNPQNETYNYNQSGSSIPTNIWINVSQSQIPSGGSVTFTCGANNATGFTIGIDRDGSRVITENISSGKTYTFDTPGSYSAYVTAHGSGGSADSGRVSFKVFRPINIGNDFYAKIIAAKDGLAIGADDSGNVSVQTRDGSDNQKWHFKRNSDGSYRISNVGQGKSLDLAGGTANFGENIQVYSDNDSNAQKWYLKLQTYGITFIPKCNTASAMDVAGGTFAAGTNIRDYQDNGSNAQYFTVEYTDLQPVATQTYNGHTYEVYDINTTWALAYKTCARLGGHLVTISSQQENDFVLSTWNPNSDTDYLWLGASDERSEGNWTWITDEAFSYKNWNSSQPDNANSTEHYLQMYNTGKWNDLPNDYSSHVPIFICEYDNTEPDGSSYTPSKTITYQGTTYEYYNTAVTWETAKSVCEAKGGHLIIIDNASENQKMKEMISDPIWLGLSDLEQEGIWTDIYGRQVSYANWKSEEPNNYMLCEDYGELYTDGTWNDIKNIKLGFICEYNHADCDHEITESFVEAPADGEQGYILHKCSKCGDSYKDNYMDYHDGWYTPSDGSSKLPNLIKNNDKYIKQYHNYSQKVQTNSPGDGWVNKGVDHKEYVNDGSPYESMWELSTSNTRVLQYDYYYHFCIPGSGINSEANYEQSGSFGHFDSVSSSQVSVAWTGDDNGHTVYVLHWGDGSTVYCQSGVTCDGAWGSHGQRSKAWYKMYVYQNKKEIIYYKWVKDSGWTDAPDPSADKTTARFQVESDLANLGDADGDGEIAAIDVTQIMRSCAHISTGIDKDVMMNADVDGNGLLEITDATYIQRYLARQQTPYAIGQKK